MRYFVNTEENYDDPELTGTSFICCVYDGESYEEIKDKIIQSSKDSILDDEDRDNIINKFESISLSDSFSEIASKIKNILHGYQKTEFHYFKISEPYTDPFRIVDFYIDFYKKANGEFDDYENNLFFFPADMEEYYKKSPYIGELNLSHGVVPRDPASLDRLFSILPKK